MLDYLLLMFGFMVLTQQGLCSAWIWASTFSKQQNNHILQILYEFGFVVIWPLLSADTFPDDWVKTWQRSVLLTCLDSLINNCNRKLPVDCMTFRTITFLIHLYSSRCKKAYVSKCLYACSFSASSNFSEQNKNPTKNPHRTKSFISLGFLCRSWYSVARSSGTFHVQCLCELNWHSSQPVKC